MLTRRRSTIIAFLLMALIGAVITTSVWRIESSRMRIRFDRTLSEMGSAASGQVIRDVTFLRATRAWIETFFQSDPGPAYESLQRSAFASYVTKLGLQPPTGGLQGIGFAPIISPENEAAVDARLARDYHLNAGIWPESTSEQRTTILLLEPASARNQAAVGYDMYSEPVRRAAMDAAMASGEISASGPVTLIQEMKTVTGDARQAGFLLYLPVTSGDEDSARTDAFVYAPILAGELFRAVLADQDGAIALRVIDQQAPETPLFTSAGYRADGAGNRSKIVFQVADRTWEIEALCLVSGSALIAHPLTAVTAAVMFLLAILTALAAQATATAVYRARQLNHLQKNALREKDLHLREMSHRLKNSLTRVAAMARQASRGAESKEDFVRSMTARLQAMAKAQDMLTRSEAGRAPLHTLIEAELAQIASDIGKANRPDVQIGGPEVLLDARETQALGLCLHELATNTLKYGAGALPEGRLSILWTLEERDGRQWLQLTWAECATGASAEPDRKGFGTQLIEACIKIELGGTIERNFGPGTMRVEINVPLSQR